MTTDRQRTYERVVGTVGHHTPAMSRRAIMTVVASHGQRASDAVRRAIRAAVENGDLVPVGDAFAPTEESALLAVIERETTREEPDRDVISRCNAALADVRE